MLKIDALTDLLLEWEERLDKDPALTVESFLCDRPEFLEPFQQLLRDLGKLSPLLHEQNGPPNPPLLSGRYHAYAFHAQGGLGQVFRAKDAEVGRDVAVKVIRPDALLRGSHTSRFVREAELTGRLEHPGIVPVYGLCKDRHGQPYYAMRFIDGTTFERVIQDFHGRADDPARAAPRVDDPGARNVELRRLLRNFVAVCETMAYAHEQGIVHRDLKPKNIMIGRFGETIVVDWGLAKNLNEPGTAADLSGIPVSSLPRAEVETPQPMGDASTGAHTPGEATKHGDRLGTPAFMSPEQARGDNHQIGPAADIYCLGATLYYLLTGRPPFTAESVGQLLGKAPQQVHQFELLDAVAAGRFAAPRSIHSTTPRSLEAVCLKAMRWDPSTRYAGAKELAADVERWLADEPVTAWREPFLIRARRWVKRHRSLVAAAGAVTLVLAATVSIAAVLLGDKNRQLVAAGNQLEEKNRQLAAQIAAKNDLLAQLEQEQVNLASSFAATRDNFDLADRSITAFAAAVNTRLPGSQHVADPVRIRLNNEARDYYRQFITANAQRAELRMELAFAHLRQAEAEIGLRNEPAALPLLEAARKRFEAIGADKPNDPHARYGLGCVDLSATMVQIHQLKVDDARKSALRACETFARLVNEKPPAKRWYTGVETPAFKLAQSVLALRDVEARTDPRQAMPFAPTVKANDDGRVVPFARAAEQALTAERDIPDDAQIDRRGMLGLVLMCLGEELAIRNQVAEGTKVFRKARVELAALLKEYPTAYEIETTRDIIDFYLALAAREEKNGQEVNQMIRARDQLRELADRSWGPDRFAVRNRARLFAAKASATLGQWSASGAAKAEALSHLQAAFADLEKVTPESGQPDLSIRLPLVESLEGVFHAIRERTEDMKLLRTIIVRIQTEMEAMAPVLADVPWFQRGRLSFDAALGAILLLHEPPDRKGLPLLRAAATGLREFVRRYPDDTLAEFQYANSLVQYGSMRAVLDNQVDEGLKDLAEARDRLARYPANGEKAELVKQIKREVPAQVVALNLLRAEQFLEPKTLDREKARRHIEVALAELVAIEKMHRLTELEKNLRGLLEQLKKQAENP